MSDWRIKILPLWGRWQREALTEGANGWVSPFGRCARRTAPSTAVPAVPLPVPGRIWL